MFGAFGIALFFLRPLVALIVAALAPGVAFCLGVVLFWGSLFIVSLSVRDHQEFAANGVSQIAPARQMDELFEDCRHFITYGPDNLPLFTSVAYFGNRYELTMRVPVKIDSKTAGSTIGEPEFSLAEVNAVIVSPSGSIQATFSRGMNFGAAEWQTIYSAKGDLSKIGFIQDVTPVADFRKFADASRPSN